MSLKIFNLRLDNKVALITGATGSIGNSISRLFAKEGASLILLGRNQNKLKSLSTELTSKYNIEVFPIRTDI
ncbi:MAG: SDR family NAD(P)-dependent oxidoreductase, partial [Candidatus Nitrosothermus koennekii]